MIQSNLHNELARRYFLSRGAGGIATAALATLIERDANAGTGLSSIPHFRPRAKRVIWLTGMTAKRERQPVAPSI